jgi:hypothetical protein
MDLVMTGSRQVLQVCIKRKATELKQTGWIRRRVGHDSHLSVHLHPQDDFHASRRNVAAAAVDHDTTDRAKLLSSWTGMRDRRGQDEHW